MTERFVELAGILNRTRDAVTGFMNMLDPVIRQATDDYERLYYHHIYEEEEHRLDRLRDLLPRIEAMAERPGDRDPDDPDFVYLLQDLGLEKFGLHNFLEHIDLALHHFQDEERAGELRRMRQMTHDDYGTIKDILDEFNERYGEAVSKRGSVPTDEKEDVADDLKVPPDSVPMAGGREPDPGPVRKRWTVGSLKH